MDFGRFQEDSQCARDMALLGKYESAAIYYQSCINAVQRHLDGMPSDNPSRKIQWTDVRVEF